MAQDNIITEVRKILEGLLAGKPLEMVEVSFKGRPGQKILKIFVDKPEGITLDECEWINRELSEALDQTDLIQEKFMLEVSSPGLDRQLKTEKDFNRVLGKEISIHLFEPVDGRRDYEGRVSGVKYDTVTVGTKEGTVDLKLDKISSARLKIDFNRPQK